MMKKIILLLLIAALSVIAMHAQNSDKTIYVIDGKQVENFDGSQLKGKTIVNYTIEPKNNIHIIITSDRARVNADVKVLSSSRTLMTDSLTQPYVDAYAKAVSVSDSTKVETEVIQDKENQIVYVVNGKIVPYSEIKDMPSSKIVSIAVIKNKQDPEFLKLSEYLKYAKDAIKYGKLDPKCIIKITTK